MISRQVNRQGKQGLLLFLSTLHNVHNAVIGSTLAWLAQEKNLLFDCYFDSYHQGIHFPGGDWRQLDEGALSGGTVSADRHFGELCFLFMNFDVSVVSLGRTMFSSAVRQFKIPVVAEGDELRNIYRDIFTNLQIKLPSSIVMIGNYAVSHLPGIENYLYPEIVYRKAVGVPETIPDDQLEALCAKDSVIICCFVSPQRLKKLRGNGYKVKIVETGHVDDTYASITKRIALRWRDYTKGFILGDPPLVMHWLPTACSENLLSIYGTPQRKVLEELEDMLKSYGNIVYGRQYSDSDFFDLSKLNCSFQVIDPCRPPFQSIKHVRYGWQSQDDGFYAPEHSTEELKQFALEGRILVSLAFWTGMIRELVNLHNLMDLIAVTKMRCGLVLSAASLEYMMHQPLELMTIPLDQGGVYPLTEPMLGSCGMGVAIESSIDHPKLQDYLQEGMQRMRERVVDSNFLPRGWWTTMDTALEKRSRGNKPKPVSFRPYPPYVKVRYHKKEKIFRSDTSDSDQILRRGRRWNIGERIKDRMRKMKLTHYFSPYRPYEFYQAGEFNPEMAAAASSAGLRYMFTKAGFGLPPRALNLDDHFIALNYTTGQWDGWTPFETVNHVADLEKSEKKLLAHGKPGWLFGTIDACLWTFGGEMWHRSHNLFQIAEFCARGGRSGRLINVRPNTIAEYARIIANMEN